MSEAKTLAEAFASYRIQYGRNPERVWVGVRLWEKLEAWAKTLATFPAETGLPEGVILYRGGIQILREKWLDRDTMFLEPPPRPLSLLMALDERPFGMPKQPSPPNEANDDD